jgi:hypothetical protein
MLATVPPATARGNAKLDVFSQVSLCIRRSAFLKQGGFTIVQGLLHPSHLGQLLDEAVRAMSDAVGSDVANDDGEKLRGGSPARKFLSAAGGTLQQSILAAPGMLQFLHDLTAVRFVPTGNCGTFSYYTRPGDHLALHRDVETCQLAVITCLHDDAASDARAGGSLSLYPARMLEPLDVIRRDPARGVQSHRLRPGETLIFYGGIVPHAVEPVIHGQRRIVSVLCYKSDCECCGGGVH